MEDAKDYRKKPIRAEERADRSQSYAAPRPTRESGLRPALGAVFPPCGASGWLRRRYLRLRDANGLLRSRCGGSQGRLRDGWVGKRFAGLGKQRSGHAQCLNFLFQPGQFQLFLPQNFIDVFHTRAPVGSAIYEEAIDRNFMHLQGICQGRSAKSTLLKPIGTEPDGVLSF